MKTVKIKTYNVKSSTQVNHFFILSKGYNAGKPLENPCPNCFVVHARDQEEKGKLFWICYALWKSGAYVPLLCGSVIPFIRINEASALIEQGIQKVSTRPEEFDKAVNQLQTMMQTEKLLNLQLKLISEIKHSVARKFLR